MSKERVAHIDMAAGIMILFMMLGHLRSSGLGYIQSPVYDNLLRIFFFYMPCFFYKSGMFFKKSDARIVGTRKLLKPFIIWSSVGFIVYAMMQIMYGTEPLQTVLLVRPLRKAISQNLIMGNKPLWFLLTLYFVYNIANQTFKKIHPLILALIGVSIGYGLFLWNNDYVPDIIANSATGLCFFCLGYWLREYDRNTWIIIVALIGYIFSILILRSPFVDIRVNQCIIDRSGFDYLLWFPASICGIIVLNAVCERLIKLYRFPFLRYIGENAMLFYVIHYFIFYAAGYLLFHIFGVSDGHVLWWLTLLSGMILVFATVWIIKNIQVVKKRIIYEDVV